MPRIIRKAQAEQDLQADVYLDDLSEAMELLAGQPLICRERLEFTPPVRIHHHLHHLIVYLALDEGINVVRVLHESMDIDGQLE